MQAAWQRLKRPWDRHKGEALCSVPNLVALHLKSGALGSDVLPIGGSHAVGLAQRHTMHSGMHNQQADWWSALMMQMPRPPMPREKPHRASGELGLCPESQFDCLLAWPQPAFVGRQTLIAMEACCLQSTAEQLSSAPCAGWASVKPPRPALDPRQMQPLRSCRMVSKACDARAAYA